MPTKLSKANDIILLQALYICYLNSAFHELVGIVADQYNQLHKPKRRRSKRSATTPAKE